MVKDRFSEFQKLSGKNAGNGRSRASTADSTTIRLDNGLPAANVNLLEEQEWEQMDSNVSDVREKITEMQTLMRRLRDIHKNKLVSPGANSESTKEMNDVVARFKDLSQMVSGFVQEINKEVRRLEKANDAVARIKKDQARTITRTFQNVLVEFNTEQVTYKEQCQKTITNYLSIAGLQMDEEGVDEAIEKGELFNTVGVMMAERDKKVLFEDVKSRHEDILKLEASIRELHEIFQDMAMLIESQGEIVDRIETNVNYAADYAERALRNVNHAQKAKNRNIKLKIAAVICAVLIIIFLVILLSSVFCLYLPASTFARSTAVRFASKSPVETLRSRLYYQSKKRGILENDILIGGFADHELGRLSESEMHEYDRVINGEHNKWNLTRIYFISGKKEPPADLSTNSAFKKMVAYADSLEAEGRPLN
ncbi:putative syntaxin-3 [Aphelenchoides fujianensis]|nr:putative syntaxin-3 [Aphelenchoides fujianensis]